jgi:hypothetical protein
VWRSREHLGQNRPEEKPVVETMRDGGNKEKASEGQELRLKEE